MDNWIEENVYGENPCKRCKGTGLVDINYVVNGIEYDADDQECPDCIDVRKMRDVMLTR